MSSHSPYSLHSSLGYQLSKTARFLERGFENELRALGLSRVSWCALLAVQNENCSQPSEIATFIGIDRTATSRALRKMEADGLIQRRNETVNALSDGRTKTVAITPKGEKLLRLGTDAARENAAKFEAKLTQVNLSELRALLLRLQRDEDRNLSHI